jgi:amino acid transporter
LTRTLYGSFWLLVYFAIVNSTVANANAGVTVSSRTAYAMGRIGVFPSVLAMVSRRHRSPVAGIVLAFAATVAVTLGMGLGYGPVTGFAAVGTAIVIVLAAVYILVNVTAIGYFARPGRNFRLVSHLLIPVLGIAAFVPVWLTAAGIPAFSFVTALTPPSSYAGLAVSGWMVLGVIYLGCLYARAPDRVSEVGLVHLDAE